MSQPRQRYNALLPPLRSYFDRYLPGVTEYELISELRAQGALPKDRPDTGLALFRLHFRLFNALYQLQDELIEQGVWLQISTLSISAGPVRLAKAGVPDDGVRVSDPLRLFYLDWTHYDEATEQTVASLLEDFWRRFRSGTISLSEREEALAELELVEPVTLRDIKQRYRKLAMVHHPDRGGSKEKLQRLNAAMAALNRYYGQL
ncbi:DNA-J related domain-containing protein [Marinimicrobium alkaliphilum]|uniref:DNA-J related domain-containing protein n=1 Tax=Marinimicrobium alkaliphilum TaxID=2202654 RepID=UPI000DBA0684|nr:DNA-J related domain-containing protein [Marinimicrobium alkaliphilum]